jgi:hypothetical protein
MAKKMKRETLNDKKFNEIMEIKNIRKEKSYLGLHGKTRKPIIENVYSYDVYLLNKNMGRIDRDPAKNFQELEKNLRRTYKPEIKRLRMIKKDTPKARAWLQKRRQKSIDYNKKQEAKRQRERAKKIKKIEELKKTNPELRKYRTEDLV